MAKHRYATSTSVDGRASQRTQERTVEFAGTVELVHDDGCRGGFVEVVEASAQPG